MNKPIFITMSILIIYISICTATKLQAHTSIRAGVRQDDIATKLIGCWKAKGDGFTNGETYSPTEVKFDGNHYFKDSSTGTSMFGYNVSHEEGSYSVVGDTLKLSPIYKDAYDIAVRFNDDTLNLKHIDYVPCS